MSRKIKIIFILLLLVIIFLAIYVLYMFNYIPHKKYDNEDFDIESYISQVDMDNDGIDDQTDILNSVREYINTKPKYKSKYYETGYPNDEYGVCTDVVGYGLKGAGYDLMELVNRDIEENKSRYNIEKADKRIDFRRVRNLNVYFENTAISLTTNIYDIKEWQGGDIVIFKNHIAIVSDRRNKKGVSFIIHHANPMQMNYEEDMLEISKEDIVGHYRVS